jgi:hypothetical protein
VMGLSGLNKQINCAEEEKVIIPDSTTPVTKTDEVDDLQMQLKELEKRLDQTHKGSASEGRCFVCIEVGHKQAECLENIKKVNFGSRSDSTNVLPNMYAKVTSNEQEESGQILMDTGSNIRSEV